MPHTNVKELRRMAAELTTRTQESASDLPDSSIAQRTADWAEFNMHMLDNLTAAQVAAVDEALAAAS